MTSREQFEEWFSNDIVGADVTFPDFEDGEYIAGEVYDDQLYIMMQAMWMAWKASREAVDIKLPAKVECSPYEHYMPQYTMDAESVESAQRRNKN
ncbi:hypothetical protein VC838_19190 [Citrobacter freundii]|nr:hypothetical protein [Citrobacter freundii]